MRNSNVRLRKAALDWMTTSVSDRTVSLGGVTWLLWLHMIALWRGLVVEIILIRKEVSKDFFQHEYWQREILKQCQWSHQPVFLEPMWILFLKTTLLREILRLGKGREPGLGDTWVAWFCTWRWTCWFLSWPRLGLGTYESPNGATTDELPFILHSGLEKARPSWGSSFGGQLGPLVSFWPFGRGWHAGGSFVLS